MARFLSLLELFREGAVAFDQVTPLGELTVRWTGSDDGRVRDRRVRGRAARGRPAVGAAADVTRADDQEETDVSETARVERDPRRPWRCRSPSCGRRWRRVLMVADQPLDVVALASAVGYPVDEVVGRARRAGRRSTPSRAAASSCATWPGAGGSTRARSTPRSSRAFVLEGQQARLTQAALETLAVVAYKQPVSRARVSAIRGVNVDGVMRTLLTRGLVEEAGQDHETGANLYRTTGYFLERIGVSSLDELPELAPYLPDMDDLEDELEAVAATEPVEPTPSPARHGPIPEPGPGTEPDGGTEPA